MYADDEVHKKRSLVFHILYSVSQKCIVLYTCVFNCHLRGSFEPRSHFISRYNMIVRVSVVLNIIGLFADSDKDDPGSSFIPILFWITLANWYCTPLSGLFFLIFLVMTPRWSNFLSSNSLWSCTLSKMMSFIMVQWCLSLVWHCMALETKILRRRSESTAYVCFDLVCGILSYSMYM